MLPPMNHLWGKAGTKATMGQSPFCLINWKHENLPVVSAIILFFFMYMCVPVLFMYVCVPPPTGLGSLEEGTGFLRTRVTGGCELPGVGAANPILGGLQEQQVLLTSEWFPSSL